MHGCAPRTSCDLLDKGGPNGALLKERFALLDGIGGPLAPPFVLWHIMVQTTEPEVALGLLALLDAVLAERTVNVLDLESWPWTPPPQPTSRRPRPAGGAEEAEGRNHTRGSLV